MTMKTFKSILFFVFALSNIPAISQTAGLEFNFGIGSYSMTEMHDLYDYYVAESGNSYKIETDFPSESYYGMTFIVGIGKFEMGIDYDRYETTGLLLGTKNGLPASFSDELTGFALGIFGKYPLYYSPNLQVKAGAVAAINGTRDRGIAMESGVRTTEYEFRSESFLVTPFVETAYYVTKWFYVGARGNFGYDLGGKLHDKKDRDITLSDQNGDAVKTNWTGIRGDVFVGFRMNNE
jgi:hypothetical protein